MGESPSSCSYHLRALGKWGFVEEGDGGAGRERPWRASAAGSSSPPTAPKRRPARRARRAPAAARARRPAPRARAAAGLAARGPDVVGHARADAVRARGARRALRGSCSTSSAGARTVAGRGGSSSRSAQPPSHEAPPGPPAGRAPRRGDRLVDRDADDLARPAVVRAPHDGLGGADDVGDHRRGPPHRGARLLGRRDRGARRHAAHDARLRPRAGAAPRRDPVCTRPASSPSRCCSCSSRQPASSSRRISSVQRPSSRSSSARTRRTSPRRPRSSRRRAGRRSSSGPSRPVSLIAVIGATQVLYVDAASYLVSFTLVALFVHPPEVSPPARDAACSRACASCSRPAAAHLDAGVHAARRRLAADLRIAAGARRHALRRKPARARLADGRARRRRSRRCARRTPDRATSRAADCSARPAFVCQIASLWVLVDPGAVVRAVRRMVAAGFFMSLVNAPMQALVMLRIPRRGSHAGARSFGVLQCVCSPIGLLLAGVGRWRSYDTRAVLTVVLALQTRSRSRSSSRRRSPSARPLRPASSPSDARPKPCARAGRRLPRAVSAEFIGVFALVFVAGGGAAYARRLTISRSRTAS